ncbi:MurR/RpiR family transcriptional regulator [Janthinobacterium agaricidamnosum]|uniref:Helix-turn-helix domain, rpiR family protein n=1 Tax=Janthinobacterium agaricidamnosum NBRC 102515 = DSM 9628 TaxID=1349767 RepID=W0V584_9BURK|nr:MurR/RpiR family transcriptional regulator [Janthinobacterium agaricidamnosum]CDG82503.1 helix-turn-helix domain, rpiR family protein [Janthinobacterium agaricidamnosum NBRC 102515 = DSM 9628]
MPEQAVVLDYASFMQQAKAGFAELSPQFQAGARYLIDHPDEIAVSSMRSVARSAGVQSSTLVRLAQHFGFAGWPALKEVFVGRVRSQPEGYAKKASAITRQSQPDSLISEVFGAQRQNLDATEARNHTALPAAASLLEQAAQVHVAGFRASHPIALSFQYLYRLFRPGVHLLGASSGSLEMGLRAIAPDHVVLLASFAPYSSEALVVAGEARRIGCKLVVISDSDAAPAALQADLVLPIAVSSPSFFPSIVAGVALAESLAELLVARGGEAAVRRIGEAEAQLLRMGAYLGHGSKA